MPDEGASPGLRAPPPPAAASTSDLEAALAGDREAWTRIVESHTNLLWWIARGYRLDQSTAADVVQTVWLQLVRKGSAIKDPSRLTAWLATTARRESLHRARRYDRQVPMESLDKVMEPEDEPLATGLLHDELTGGALAAFRELGADCRRLLSLLCADPPLTYKTIAETIGRSVGSIGPTRERCLTRLRATMKTMGLHT